MIGSLDVHTGAIIILCSYSLMVYTCLEIFSLFDGMI
jgi:hypothetical protein